METPVLIPVIVVDDIKKAFTFYSKLGFAEENEYAFADDAGVLIHAQVPGMVAQQSPTVMSSIFGSSPQL
ncbi:MAG TPA: hypothetical protein VJP80_05290 [Candidatus Saccharimonadales bacterium]|nr:hypothetical protein [Candidatus Saccharimonadales bacterium]